MIKLIRRRMAVISFDLSIACVAALALPATGFAAPPEGGEGPPPQLSFTPGSYDFGIQLVNRGEGSTDFQLTNVGTAETQLGGVGIGGKNPSNFWTNGGDCSPGRWLQPGESCNVGVGFNPWELAPYEAELQAYVAGATFTATLSGQGGRAIVEATETPAEFGAVAVGAPGVVYEIEFVNHGNAPGSFFIAVIASGSVGSFQLLDENCTGVPLLPEESCTAEVRFEPQGIGPKLARLALFGDDDGGAMVELSGEGLAAEPPLAGAAATGVATGAASAAAAPASSSPPRTKRRRFGRNTSLATGRAHCTALCPRGKALRKRTAVAGG